MPRPSINPRVRQLIAQIWDEDQSQSAAKVHRKICQRSGSGVVSDRTVRKVIRELKKANAQGDRPTPQHWDHWTDNSETAEESSFLLMLDAVNRSMFGSPINMNQANWGRRLRVCLEELSPLLQTCFVREYSARDLVGMSLSRATTLLEELDAFIAYSPWRSADSLEGYKRAIQYGYVQPCNGASYMDMIGVDNPMSVALPSLLSDLFWSDWSPDDPMILHWTNGEGVFWKDLRSENWAAEQRRLNPPIEPAKFESSLSPDAPDSN